MHWENFGPAIVLVLQFIMWFSVCWCLCCRVMCRDTSLDVFGKIGRWVEARETRPPTTTFAAQPLLQQPPSIGGYRLPGYVPQQQLRNMHQAQPQGPATIITGPVTIVKPAPEGADSLAEILKS